MAQFAEKLWTVDDFLTWEASQTVKHEFVAGEIHAMVGGTIRHLRIVGNLHSGLHQALRGTPCEVFAEGAQLRAADIVSYPDIMVTCEGPNPLGYDAQEPKVLIEVLSPSTEGMDRGPKWLAYQTISSLVHFVLVAQDRPYIEMYTGRGSRWVYITLDALDANLALAAIGVSLPLREIYDRCFPEAAAG